MKRLILFSAVVMIAGIVPAEVRARGFGGFRAAGFSGARFSGGVARSYSGGFGRSFSSFSGVNRLGGSYSGARSTAAYSGWGSRGIGSTYDRSWSSARGGTLSTSGTRGIAEGRFGGVAAGGTRDTTLTTASGRTFSADRRTGIASGPFGGTVGRSSTTLSGVRGTRSWETAFSGNRYTGNMSHYASIYGANGLHSTAHWSTGYLTTRAAYVRGGFGYYTAFRPAWYVAHPGCWVASAWAAGVAWNAATYYDLANYCGLPVLDPEDYDYGSGVVYQGNNVYVNGQSVATTQQYAQQATTLATEGQTAKAAPTGDWKPIGVFALVEGDEKTSNNIFQLAINKAGIIRGNYYNGLLDSTTEVFGAVNKKSQRAAWTIGKKKDRVFEAGVFNLTEPQCPCLVHVGTDKTTQMMLVRIKQPQTKK